jgi:hypothetical protein
MDADKRRGRAMNDLMGPMRRSFGLVLLALLIQAHSSLGNPPSMLKVPDGTTLRLSLMDTLNSDTNQVDDPVHLEVTEDVKLGDVVAIPRGPTATGHVVEVEPRRRLGRSGKLNFMVDYVKAPDGTNLRLRASSTRKGEDKTGTVIVGTVLLSPLFLIMRGKDINIPKGTQFNAYVDGDREIALGGAPASAVTTSGNPSLSAAPAGEAAGKGAASTSIAVAVTSTPDGADITVDGKYKGSTPSSLRVEAGDHSISVEKPGFKKWQRTVSIDAGSNMRLDMTLEPDQSANIVQVPSNPPVSATQPHEAAQIVPPSSDIQKRQPTAPATGESAIKPIKSGAGTAQISGEQGMTGSFEGEVRNETLGVTAGYEITVREENGGIYGCSTVQTPLSGSGGFNGSVNGSRVVFETEGKKLHIRFIGELQGDEMKGTYTVLSTSERGGFVLKRTNYNAPPFGFDTKKCRKD